MKTLNKIFTAAALVTFASFANAQTDDFVPFESGAAATAASVNANFDALITVIDGLTADVAALQSEVESLGGAPGNVTLEDLVGTNYCVSYFGNIGQSVNNGTYATSESYVGSVKLAITSTSTGTMTVVHDENFELGWGLGFDGEFNVLDADLNANVVDEPGSEAAVTAISLTGGILSVTIDGDTNNFNLSPDGNMMLGTNFDSTTEDAETNVIIGMRCI